MNIYYVYFYLRGDFTPYYVGKGKGNRYKSKNKSQISLPKDKTKIILVKQNLTELQAFILERYYIRWFGRKDNGTGILRNKTDGGEGVSGKITSESTKEKISKANKGRKCSPMKLEIKEKISNSLKGKSRPLEIRIKISESNKGLKRSLETRKRISDAKKETARKPHSEETKQKLSNLKMGVKQPPSTCPYCNKTGGSYTMKRWHFDNCKSNSRSA
jgi:flagellar basal body-associated protein FliL